jgi:uncharacterized protein (TIGR02118 family)
MTVLRVCYKSGIRFDDDYYVSRHVPLAAEVMGPHGVVHIEVVRVTAVTAPYQVMFSAYFESETGLQNALKSRRMAEVLGDIPNYHDGNPDVMIGEAVAVPVVR